MRKPTMNYALCIMNYCCASQLYTLHYEMNRTSMKYSPSIALIFGALLCFLTSCSNRDYVASIPADTPLVIAIDFGKANGVDNKALLKTLLHVGKVDECGLDFSEKAYLYLTPDGTLGLCLRILSKSDLTSFFARMASAGQCSPTVSRRGFDFTVVDERWVAAFSDEALLMQGPVAPMSQVACQQQMTDYLSQDAAESFLSTKLFAKLDSIDAPMAMVAQVQALPEMLSAPLMLGAPKGATADQVLLASAMRVEGKTLFVEDNTFSFNPRIEAAITSNLQSLRPIGNTFLRRVPRGAGATFFYNVNGNQFLPLVQTCQSSQTLLAGINSAIDIDNIIRSIDGDLCLSFGTVAGSQHLAMGAVLGHSRWLADVEYWKTSCPSGSHIDDWTTNGFVFRDGTKAYYFGVSPDGLYYSGGSADEARAFLSDCDVALPSAVADVIKNSRMAVVVTEGLPGTTAPLPLPPGGRGHGSGNYPLPSKFPSPGDGQGGAFFFIDIDTIVYYNKL